jgi:hypothetical protein
MILVREERKFLLNTVRGPKDKKLNLEFLSLKLRVIFTEWLREQITTRQFQNGFR